MKEKQIKNVKRIFKYLILILSFYIVYSAGTIHGLIAGIHAVIEKEDMNICDFMNLEEEDGYCILSEEAKFNQEVSCYFGDFKVKGGVEPTGEIKRFIDVRNFITKKIFLRC